MANSFEENLIERCMNGEPEAFGPLIKLYKKQLFSYVFRLIGEKSAAEDAFQETLIKAWKGIIKYSDKQKFSSWLFTIAHNCCMDELRKRKPDKIFSGNEPDDFAGYDDPIKKIEKEELRKMISSAIEKLSVKQKNVFLLRVECGFAFKEIAEITGEQLNTVLSHMNYSIKKIKKTLAGIYE
jgi:RNA polymerase sigma-70 factor, ECF subfamily